MHNTNLNPSLWIHAPIGAGDQGTSQQANGVRGEGHTGYRATGYQYTNTMIQDTGGRDTSHQDTGYRDTHAPHPCPCAHGTGCTAVMVHLCMYMDAWVRGQGVMGDRRGGHAYGVMHPVARVIFFVAWLLVTGALVHCNSGAVVA